MQRQHHVTGQCGQRLDAEAITVIADEFGYAVQFTSADDELTIEEEEDDEESLQHRAPIVTIQDGASHAMSFLGSVFGVPVVPLGVDEFGQSGSRAALYHQTGMLLVQGSQLGQLVDLVVDGPRDGPEAHRKPLALEARVERPLTGGRPF